MSEQDWTQEGREDGPDVGEQGQARVRLDALDRNDLSFPRLATPLPTAEAAGAGGAVSITIDDTVSTMEADPRTEAPKEKGLARLVARLSGYFTLVTAILITILLLLPYLKGHFL